LKKIQRASQQTAHQRRDMFDMFADENDEVKSVDSRVGVPLATQVTVAPYTSTLADNWDDSEGYYRKSIEKAPILLK
jgi:hypothetical protein